MLPAAARPILGERILTNKKKPAANATGFPLRRSWEGTDQKLWRTPKATER